MSSPPDEAPDSTSRAREQHPEESRDEPPRPRPRVWVALSSLVLVLDEEDDHDPAMLAPGPGGADLLLHLQPPLLASYLVLPERIAPESKVTGALTYIVAACSNCLLVIAFRGDASSFNFFLGDVYTLTVTLVPIVPFHLRYNHGLDLVPGRSIGLVDDPRNPDHHMLFQLHPIPTTTRRYDTLLCYSSATDDWTAKALASVPDPYNDPWNTQGVISHDGLMWWIDIAYGMLVCDPFADYPDLAFVPLPANCQHPASQTTSTMLLNRRFIRPSQGKLRYVQMTTGFAYDMFTLVNSERPGRWRWQWEYTVNFATIWGHPLRPSYTYTTFIATSLALVDPNDADIVCFFRGTLLFAVDRQSMCVIDRKIFLVDSTHRNIIFQTSGFINAWELPLPTIAPTAGNVPDDVDDEVASLLSQMEINSLPEGAIGSPELQSMVEDMAPPSESSWVASDQAIAEADQTVAEANQADAEAGEQVDAAGAAETDQTHAEAGEQADAAGAADTDQAHAEAGD